MKKINRRRIFLIFIRTHAELPAEGPGKALMAVKQKIHRNINNLNIIVPQLHGRFGEPVHTDIFKRRLAGKLFENPGAVPGRIACALCKRMQRNRFIQMSFDIVLHLPNRINLFPAFHVVFLLFPVIKGMVVL